MALTSGFLIQSSYGAGDNRNFEVVVPRLEGGFAHYFRNNQDPSLPWVGPTIHGEGRIQSVSFFESDYRADDNSGHSDFELVALVDAQLQFYWRENADPYAWSGPSATGAFFVGGSSALIPVGTKADPNENNVGGHPFGGGLIFHYNFAAFTGLLDTSGFGFVIRKNFPNFNEDGGMRWDGGDIIDGPGIVSGIAAMQSTVGTGDPSFSIYAAGDLVVAACQDDALVIWRLQTERGRVDDPTRRSRALWGGPFLVGKGFRGRPSIIQSTFGYIKGELFGYDHYGHYELAAPMIGGGIAHFWLDPGRAVVKGGVRDIDDNITNWNGPAIFAEGIQYDEVSMIQSSFSSSGDNGNFELVARRRDQQGFDHWWREDGGARAWHGPLPVV